MSEQNQPTRNKDNRLRPAQRAEQKMTFSEYKQKVAECLMKNEGLTEAEARDWMNKDEEDLRTSFGEKLRPLTAAQILIA
jgi:hypothetical protein